MMAVAVWADPPAWQAVFRAIVRGIGELTGGVEEPGQAVGAVDQGAPAERQRAAGNASVSRKRRWSRRRRWMPSRARW